MGSAVPVAHLWIVSAPDALSGAASRLRPQGVRVHRLAAVGFEPEPPDRLRARLDRWGAFDTLVVTSPRAIPAFVRPVIRPKERRRRGLQVWAAGAGSARRLLALGFLTVRRAREEGATALGSALLSGPRRSIVYPRSDRAGPELARRWRRAGHRVLDLVAYRTVLRKLPVRTLRRLGTPRSRVLVTSPSALSALRSSLSSAGFRRWRRGIRLVALGTRTQRSARGHGFRGVERLAEATVEGLTAYWARAGRDGAR